MSLQNYWRKMMHKMIKMETNDSIGSLAHYFLKVEKLLDEFTVTLQSAKMAPS